MMDVGGVFQQKLDRLEGFLKEQGHRIKCQEEQIEKLKRTNKSHEDKFNTHGVILNGIVQKVDSLPLRKEVDKLEEQNVGLDEKVDDLDARLQSSLMFFENKAKGFEKTAQDVRNVDICVKVMTKRIEKEIDNLVCSIKKVKDELTHLKCSLIKSKQSGATSLESADCELESSQEDSGKNIQLSSTDDSEANNKFLNDWIINSFDPKDDILSSRKETSNAESLNDFSSISSDDRGLSEEFKDEDNAMPSSRSRSKRSSGNNNSNNLMLAAGDLCSLDTVSSEPDLPQTMSTLESDKPEDIRLPSSSETLSSVATTTSSSEKSDQKPKGKVDGMMTKLKDKWMENAEQDNATSDDNSPKQDKESDDQNENLTKISHQRKSSSSSQSMKTVPESASLTKDDQGTGNDQEAVTEEKPESPKANDENVTTNLLNILKKEMLTENDPSKSPQDVNVTSPAKKGSHCAPAKSTNVTPAKTAALSPGKQQKARKLSAGKSATVSPAKNLLTLATTTTTAKGSTGKIAAVVPRIAGGVGTSPSSTASATSVTSMSTTSLNFMSATSLTSTSSTPSVKHDPSKEFKIQYFATPTNPLHGHPGYPPVSYHPVIPFAQPVVAQSGGAGARMFYPPVPQIAMLPSAGYHPPGANLPIPASAMAGQPLAFSGLPAAIAPPQAFLPGSAHRAAVPYAAALPAAPAVAYPGLNSQQQAAAAAAAAVAQQTALAQQAAAAATATQAQYAYNASGNFAQHVTDEEVLIAKIPPQVRKQYKDPGSDETQLVESIKIQIPVFYKDIKDKLVPTNVTDTRIDVNTTKISINVSKDYQIEMTMKVPMLNTVCRTSCKELTAGVMTVSFTGTMTQIRQAFLLFHSAIVEDYNRRKVK